MDKNVISKGTSEASVDSLIRRATMGEKIDKKKLSPTVKEKLKKIGSFEMVVNAIIG